MKASASLRLREAGADDAEFIFRLRNADEVRAVSRRRQPLERDSFEREIVEAIKRSDADVFVIDVEGRAAGYVRIEPRRDGAYEIGIALDEPFRRRGLGVLAIRAATDMFKARRPGGTLFALARAENVASTRAFEAAGYTAAGQMGEFTAYRA